MKNIQLLGDRLFARLIEKDTSDGGVVLPQCAGSSATQRMAKVLNVGPGLKAKDGSYISPEVEASQRVILDFNGGWVSIGGELLISTTARNVLAVLEEVPE
jgi:co-chaperonin GroES (HSP10)